MSGAANSGGGGGGWLSFLLNRRAAQPAPASASAAKERLQIILSHERIGRGGDDFLPRLQKEIVDVVMRYVAVDPAKVNVSLERGADLSALAISVELPAPKADEGRRTASAA